MTMAAVQTNDKTNSNSNSFGVEALSRASLEFEQSIDRNNDRTKFLVDVAKLIIAYSNAGIVFRYTATRKQNDQPSDVAIEPLASQFETVPDNVAQWAFLTAQQAIIAAKPIVQTSPKPDAGPVHLVAVPTGNRKNENEVLLALYVDGSPDGFPEQSFMQLACQNIKRWNSERQNINSKQLAADVAAIREIGSAVGTSKNAKSACQRIAKNVAEFIDQLPTRTADNFEGEPEILVGTVDENSVPTLIAISNSDTLPEDPTLIDSIESAMAEGLCRNVDSFWPPADDASYGLLCHSRLAEKMDAAYVATIPLCDSDGTNYGIVQCVSPHPLQGRAVRFLQSCSVPFGSTLSLVKRAEENRVQQFLTSIKTGYRKQKTKTVLKCLGAIFLLGMIPLPYKVNSSCEVQPTTRRFISAPFDAQLKESLVEPGDIVVQGQALAQLDEKEINLELAEVKAEYHRATKKRDGFVASHESGDARLAQHEAEMYQARNDLLVHRANSLELCSPIDGIVIAGDHKNAEGMPVKTGQSMFEVAPLNNLTVDLFVPDKDVRYVEPGMTVKIRLDAFPFQSWNGVVENVHPAAEIRQDENVFVATVNIENANGQLRPGMQGSAKTKSHWRPIWWNFFHKPAAKCLRVVGW